MINDRPIGVFDSGIGGLTVLSELITRLPNESFIYLGDTARIPYGTRSKTTIKKFSLQLVEFLLKRKVKALVVACNTICAAALDEIRKRSPVPVIDVIAPTLSAARKVARGGRVAVIGTRATIASGVYKTKLAVACPLFVPLVEEGWGDDLATELIAAKYLRALRAKHPTVLILGCTHYPVMREVISKVIGPGVTIVQSGLPVARELRRVLAEKNLANRGKKRPNEFYVTDDPGRAAAAAKRFFGGDLPGIIKQGIIE